MEKILLGMLMQKPYTGYDIRKKMELSTKFFFSTSQGSINPAFKKLERNGLVTTEEEVSNGRLHKIYTITESGRSAFKEWLNSKVGVSKVKNDMLLRLFFFPYVSKDEKIQILENYLSELKMHIETMHNLGDVPQVRENCNKYEMATLEFGIGYYSFILGWYTNYLKQIKGEI
ncbi:MAG: PadR family transcriptional regulator [Candidatus Cloacimonetes bacterium]|nr:PadR family transcriptional regulator [Candidatus Cloacimonadota bacterium]